MSDLENVRQGTSIIMRRSCLLLFNLLLAFLMMNCSSSNPSSNSNNNNSNTSPIPNISGPWEFIATSNVSAGSSTAIEVALQEGQVLNATTQSYAPNGQISASGSQISYIGLSSGGAITFGGNCIVAGTDTSGNNLAGSITGAGGAFSATYNENGNDFTITGTLSADGQSMTGTYTSQTGSNCLDNGTISGQVVPKLSGNYSGSMILPDGSSQGATATLTENSSTTLTLNLILSNNTSFTVSGPVTAHTFAAQGTFAGSNVSYNGFLDCPTIATGNAAVYLENSTDPTQSSKFVNAGGATGCPAP